MGQPHRILGHKESASHSYIQHRLEANLTTRALLKSRHIAVFANSGKIIVTGGWNGSCEDSFGNNCLIIS